MRIEPNEPCFTHPATKGGPVRLRLSCVRHMICLVLFATAVSIYNFLLAAVGAAVWLTAADALPLDGILLYARHQRNIAC
jgi:hypothetical protein